MKKFLASFTHAFRGILSSVKTERNFKVQIFAAVLVLLLTFFLEAKLVEWAIIIVCVVMVLALEMINSAIEKICDLMHPEQSPKIKIIKDIAAGAVLITSIGAAVIAAIILLPKLFLYF